VVPWIEISSSSQRVTDAVAWSPWAGAFPASIENGSGAGCRPRPEPDPTTEASHGRANPEVYTPTVPALPYERRGLSLVSAGGGSWYRLNCSFPRSEGWASWSIPILAYLPAPSQGLICPETERPMDRALWRRYGLRFEIHPFDADWYSVGGIYIFSFFNRATQLWEVLYVGQTESYRNRLCLAHRQAVSGNGSGGHSRPCSVTPPQSHPATLPGTIRGGSP
jgi:hypothetical protein